MCGQQEDHSHRRCGISAPLVLWLILFYVMAELTIRPNSKAQERFLAASEYEVLYGGAAGGGKTEGIIIDPLRYKDYSWFNAIIFRESFAELEKAVIPEAKRIYQAAGATYHEQKKRFSFKSGAYIDLAYLAGNDDWQNYQGAGYVAQYFDELTNIQWENYDKLGMWNRAQSIDCPIQPYRRAATNPGGISHSQVKQHFVDVCQPLKDGSERWSELGKMMWQPMRPGPRFTWTAPNGMKLTRRYIPARVFDNVDLLKNSPLYLAQLLAKDEATRRKFIEGSWDVYEGQFFWMFSRDRHVLDADSFVRDTNWPIGGTIDYGERTVLEVATVDYEGNVVFFTENYTEHMDPHDRANAMADLLIAEGLKRLKIEYDTNMDISLQYYAGTQKKPIDIFREVFKQRMKDEAPTLTVVSKREPNMNYRIVANETFRDYLGWKLKPDGTYERRPRLYICDSCPKLIESIGTLMTNPDSKKGLDFFENVGFDDPYDAAKMRLLVMAQKAVKPEPNPPSWFQTTVPSGNKAGGWLAG